MSLSTAAAAKAQFGDLLTASQTVAANTPATAAAAKFSEYLVEKQPANRPGSLKNIPAPRPEQLAKLLFGTAYDPGTGTVKLDKLTAIVRQHTAEFAAQLHERLSAAGIDTTQPVNLSIGADGRIIVDNTSLHAVEIAKLFRDDPSLAQAYRNVAAQNDHLAILQTGADYVKEWNATKTDGDRQAIWSRYSTLMDRLSGMFSGRMTFGTGTATAESQQMLRRMGIAQVQAHA